MVGEKIIVSFEHVIINIIIFLVHSKMFCFVPANEKFIIRGSFGNKHCVFSQNHENSAFHCDLYYTIGALKQENATVI